MNGSSSHHVLGHPVGLVYHTTDFRVMASRQRAQWSVAARDVLVNICILFLEQLLYQFIYYLYTNIECDTYGDADGL